MFLFLKGIGERDGDTHCDVINSFMVVNYYDLQSAVYIFHVIILGEIVSMLMMTFRLFHLLTWYQKEKKEWHEMHDLPWRRQMHFWSWEISSLSILCYKNRLFFLFHLERFSAINLITHLFLLLLSRASWMKEKTRMWSKHMYDTPEWVTTTKNVLKLHFVRNLLVAWSCVNCMTTLSASDVDLFAFYLLCAEIH